MRGRDTRRFDAGSAPRAIEIPEPNTITPGPLQVQRSAPSRYEVPRCSHALAVDAEGGTQRYPEGLAATAIAAVDAAIWDLKAKLLRIPLALLFGRMRDAVPIHGSGGLTNYSDERLTGQLSAWVQPRWLPLGEDEDRQRAGSRSHSRPAGKTRDRRGHPIRRCQRRDSAEQALALAKEFANSGVAWSHRLAAGRRAVRGASHRPVRPLCSCAASATSAFADSAIEHYRGAFENRAMYIPQVTAAGGIAGVIGTGFHTYNVTKRPAECPG